MNCIISAVYKVINRMKGLIITDDIYDCLVDEIITIKATFDTPLILLGDFNSRAGVAPGFEQMPGNGCSFLEESQKYLLFQYSK